MHLHCCIRRCLRISLTCQRHGRSGWTPWPPRGLWAEPRRWSRWRTSSSVPGTCPILDSSHQWSSGTTSELLHSQTDELSTPEEVKKRWRTERARRPLFMSEIQQTIVCVSMMTKYVHRVHTHVDQWISRTVHPISMTKYVVKSQCVTWKSKIMSYLNQKSEFQSIQ